MGTGNFLPVLQQEYHTLPQKKNALNGQHAHHKYLTQNFKSVLMSCCKCLGPPLYTEIIIGVNVFLLLKASSLTIGYLATGNSQICISVLQLPSRNVYCLQHTELKYGIASSFFMFQHLTLLAHRLLTH